MSISRQNIKIEIRGITNVIRERRINGNVSFIGKVRASIEDEELDFDFEYTGKGNEDKRLLLDYLRTEAWQRYEASKQPKQDNSLDDLINMYLEK